MGHTMCATALLQYRREELFLKHLHAALVSLTDEDDGVMKGDGKNDLKSKVSISNV